MKQLSSVTKVLGEELCRAYHEMTGAAVAMPRYHEFVPAPYLEYGVRLLRNGVDRSDVVSATLAALRATIERRVERFRTIVHTDHGMPPEVIGDFRRLGPEWCERRVPGARGLIEKYSLVLPPHRRASRPLGSRARPRVAASGGLHGFPPRSVRAGCARGGCAHALGPGSVAAHSGS